MKVSLVNATPSSIDTIAKIASICYDSDPKNALGLVKHLYKNGHHSVFEHTCKSLSFVIYKKLAIKLARVIAVIAFGGMV